MSVALEVGSIVEGKVVKIKPFGAIVSIEDKVQGLVHISQISSNFVQNIEDHIAVGDVIKVKVLSKDESAGKLSLSIKDALPPSQSTNNRPRKPQSSFQHKNNDTEKKQESSFDDKLKDWIKQSNERQAGINKRNNRR